MRLLYTILLWIFSVYLLFGGARVSEAQVRQTVLVETPKPLADISQLKGEPDPEAILPVGQRTPSDLSPIPIQWRGFEISTLLMSSQIVDTNLFVTDTDEEADTITSLAPSVFIQKDIGRHNLNAAVGAELKKYWSNTDEDVFNYNGTIGGNLEARHDIHIPFELSYASGHEARGQNLIPNFSKKPIAFNSFGSALGISYDSNRLGLSLIGRYSEITFDNGTNRAGQAVVRDDADRSFGQLEFGASYKILPNHQPFLSASYGKTDYKRGGFSGGSYSLPEQDSTNINFLAGWKLTYKGLLEGSFAFGYATQDYDDDRIEDINSSSIASNINWNVTKRATLNLALSRAIKDDNENLQGLVLTEGRVGLDLEFLHNLFYNAFVDYAFSDFQNITREDDNLALGTGLRYVLSPRLSISGEYDFKTRESTAFGLDYDRHQFMVRLHSRF